MTKQEKYTLGNWAMQFALENGAQQVSVSIAGSINSSVEFRDEKMDKLEQSIQNGLSIRLYVDGRYSAHSTNRLKKEDLQHFILQGIESTRFLAEDAFRVLPDPGLYYQGNGVDLETLDPQFEAIKPEQKIELAASIEAEVLGKDERIISVSTAYFDGKSERVMVTSNGFKGDSDNTYFGLSAEVSIKDGEARPEGSWYESAIVFDKLRKSGMGLDALNKAVQKCGQKKIASEQLPMLVENRQLTRILSPLISALSGAAIQQKNSFLMDQLHQKVFSDKLSILDEPHLPGARGSKLFDGEGLATKTRSLIKNGVVSAYLIDTYYARKLNVEPTGGSTSNLVFKHDEVSKEELIKTIQRGIYVTGFNGGNCNGTTGDFSYGVEGFLIENGEFTQAISEMNITGNMIQLWSNISFVANDAYELSAWRTPSVLFDAVDFSGV